MSTLDQIKKLSDGQFHRLGDDLLRRIDPRYRRLRTHGLNERGESIIGQPDSYVGETAATCTIAVCYTVKRKGWWTKLIADVREVVTASPLAKEIVVVFPFDADRDGPTKKKKGKRIEWLSDAKKEAGEASLRVIDGRDLERELDTAHQDLRHEHFRIPYSRLSRPSILAGCRIATRASIDHFKISGRYDPERYVPRVADGELHRQWQAAFRPNFNDGNRTSPVRFIPLVSDSGMGKTSLVCQFALTLGKVLPVLLIQAADLTFGTEDGLVAHVIQAVQGALDQSTRVIEEAAVSRLLASSIPLTVILDGLDESQDSSSVRKAISFWMRSKFCQYSILITTSRREFWGICADASWERWMPSTIDEDRSPVKIANRSLDERFKPLDGIRLPTRFSEEELESAWLQAGEPRQELSDFPSEAREELRHPFTLRVFLDLRKQEGHTPRSITRTALLERWLNCRFDAEAMPEERITRTQFNIALRLLASRLSVAKAGFVIVDDLSGLPRFDPVHPPGPVIERLIEANILESLPGQSDKIRFSVAAVQDFFQAEADLEEIRTDPGAMAERYSHLSFTAAYPRLARLGYRLFSEDVRDAFARRLAELDARMAAIVIRAIPGSFSPDIRARIAGELGNQLSARHRVRAAMAITLLGELNCPESSEALANHVLAPADIHPHLKPLGATAFTKLGYVPAASFVYRWEQFGIHANNENYFFKEILATLRASTPEFRRALAVEALQSLSNATGTMEHAKVVTVLAYIGDGSLVDHLKVRLDENGMLEYYENHALIALGSDAAGDLFARSVLAVGEKLAVLPNDAANHDARNHLMDKILCSSYDLRYLISKQFEPYLRRLIENENLDVSWMGCDLARSGLVPTLMYSVAVSATKRIGWHDSFAGNLRDCTTAEMWLDWWGRSSDDVIRREVLGLLPSYPNAEIEAVLMDSLDSPKLRGWAARGLGEYGAIRSTALLRGMLEETGEDDEWNKYHVAQALGNLRDESSVPLLEKIASEHSNDDIIQQSVTSLGLIGNLTAEQSLQRLLQRDGNTVKDESIFEALLMCGSESAVAFIVSHARLKQDGALWLCERIHNLSLARGWRRGRYYIHIHTVKIVEYLDSQELPAAPEHVRQIGEAFEQIDSPSVRELLKKWARLRGSEQDLLVRVDGRKRLSDICYSELRDRGDESAIDYTLDEWSNQPENFVYSSLTAKHLRPFPAASVGKRLRLRLEAAATTYEIVRMLSLIGQFGEAMDADLASQLIDYPDDLVANVACETMLRLSDPLLVPDRWREL